MSIRETEAGTGHLNTYLWAYLQCVCQHPDGAPDQVQARESRDLGVPLPEFTATVSLGLANMEDLVL